MALFPPGPGGGQEIDHGYKGKGSLIHLAVEKNGMPLVIRTTAANGDERKEAIHLIHELSLRQINNKSDVIILEADKGYDADWLRQELLKEGYFPIIKQRGNRKNRVSTQQACNTLGIVSRRWVVERTFSWIKRKYRRLLLRWERLAKVWQAFNYLAIIYMWM